MSNPAAAYTFFNFTSTYLTVRMGGAPGSGTWSAPTTLFSGASYPTFAIADQFSAEVLSSDNTESKGILFRDGNVKLVFLGNGAPPTPTLISVGADTFPAADNTSQWAVSQGAWSHGGNLYAAVSQNYSSITPTSIIKSTDGGATWTYMDAAHQPPRSDAVALQRVGNVIVFAVSVSSPGFGLALWFFDLTTDTWSAQTGFLVNFPLQDFGSTRWLNSVWQFPNGDIGLVFDHDSSGIGPKVAYALYASGSWTTTEIPIPGGSLAQMIVDPSGETLHVFAYNTAYDTASGFVYSKVAHNGTVAGSIFTSPARVAGSDGVGHGSIQDSMILVPYDDFGKTANSIWVAPLATGAFQEELLPDGGIQPSCAYMITPSGVAPPPTLTLACPIGTTAQVGVPYTGMLLASGGTPPYTYAIIA